LNRNIHYLFGAALGTLAYALLLQLVPDPDIALIVGVSSFIIYLWLTEPVSMQVSSLFPILLFPVFGVLTLPETTSSYAHPVIFLLLGGFILAKGLEKWNIHKRVALILLSKFGGSLYGIIASMMIATALISMCISNTATTMMMLPIGLSIMEIVKTKMRGGKVYSTVMLVSIAYAANVGGEGTIIGSPPNVILVGMIEEQYGFTISFFEWMLFAIPLVVLLLTFGFFLLTRFLPSNTTVTTDVKTFVFSELKSLGPVKGGELRVILILGLAMLLWVFKSPVNELLGKNYLSDATAGLFCGILMLIIPVEKRSAARLLTWQEAQRISWGILLFFGGALTLAKGLKSNGAIDWVSSGLTALPEGLSSFMIIGLSVTVMIILTEFMGGTALSSVFVPVLFGVSEVLNIPVLEICLPVVFASNCSFMLPMATAPNAIVFSTGQLRIKDMAVPGLLMNLVGIAIIWLIGLPLIKVIF